MNRTRASIAVIAAATVGLSLALPGAALAAESTAPVPTPEVASQTTNAMLQPTDISGALGAASGLQTGYVIPPGGQDPFPLCYKLGRTRVLPSLDGAIGYSSTAGQVTEEIYVYPSATAAQSAWAALDRQIARTCTFVQVDGKDRVRGRQGQLPDGSGRWVQMDLSLRDSPAFYSTVGLVDDGIVITRFQGKKGLRQTTATQRAATDALFGVLTERYADRTTLGQVQPAAVSAAQQALLQPSDIPSSLPIQQPAAGAWTSQSAQVPGQAPFNRCDSRKDLLPDGSGTFTQSLGSSGDVFIKTGLVYEQAMSYDSADSARAAWTTLNRTIKDCNRSEGTLYAKGGNYRTVTGTVDVDGMPGLYVREVDTENFGAGSRFVTKAYTVYVLKGDSIVSVQYARSKMGMTRFAVDEAAVRDLTALAAQKWSERG